MQKSNRCYVITCPGAVFPNIWRFMLFFFTSNTFASLFIIVHIFLLSLGQISRMRGASHESLELKSGYSKLSAKKFLLVQYLIPTVVTNGRKECASSYRRF